MCNSTLFQQVSINVGAVDLSRRAELDTNEFTEPGRVVVSDGLCVAERLEDGVCLEDLGFEGP